MRRISLLMPSLLLMSLICSPSFARPVQELQNISVQPDDQAPLPQEARGNSSRADTLFLFAASGPGAWGMPGTDSRGYTFNSDNPAGWIGEDLSVQIADFWHVASTSINDGFPTQPIQDVAPFDPGDTTNDFALWCGAQVDCGWDDDLGYGNNWKQWAILDTGGVGVNLELDFWYISDFEGDTYDYFEVLLEVGEDLEVIYHNDTGNDVTLRHLNVTAAAVDYDDPVGDVYLYFTSDGAWSDQDGSYESDVGAVWIDNVTLSVDGSEVFRDDFETGVEPAGITFTGPAGAGDFAALYMNLYSEAPCVFNTSHAWAFFDLDATNPEYPIPVVAYGPPYVHDVIVSPLLDMSHVLDDPTGEPVVIDSETTVLLNFWVYCDLPQSAEVYSSFYVGAYCPELSCLKFVKLDHWWSPPDPWGQYTYNVTQDLMESADGAEITGVQVKLGVIDMCGVWCGTPGHGDGTGHTPAPYYDNVRVMLVSASITAWNIDIFNRFQDNFPLAEADGAGGQAGMVRIDNAHNIEPSGSPTVVRGDSCVIELNMDLAEGVAESYCAPAGEMRPNLWQLWRVVDGPHTGVTDGLAGDPDGSDGIYSPWEGTEEIHGVTWNRTRCDLGYLGGTPSAHKYTFDFNDGYFEPGDRIQFFYQGEARNGTVETRPVYAMDPNLELQEFYQVRCLPTPGATLLFVDDARGCGPWWREAFTYNGYLDYDEFFTQAASSGLENGPGGMGRYDVIADYSAIIWDCGGLDQYTICTAENGDKSDDAALLDQWLSDNTHDTALWVMGDQVANDLGGTMFLTETMGVNLLDSDDYYDDLTGISTPMVYATHPALEYLGGTPYFWVDGGCPNPNNFALIEPNDDLAITTHEWEEDGGSGAVAGILNLDPDGDGTDTSTGGHINRTLMMPFSYWTVIDAGYAVPAQRIYARLMVGHILEYLFGEYPEVPFNGVPGDVPVVTRLQGNYPNPFNPSTEISFSLARTGPVSLQVHDLAGRLVKTLVDGPLPAGERTITWRGGNDSGRRVASGVYFLRMKAGDYRASSKLVLMK